jgi:hypothetical protein
LSRLPRQNWFVTTLSVLLAIGLTLAVVGGCTSNAVAPGNSTNQDKLDWLNQTFADGGASRGSGLDINSLPVLFDTTLTNVVSPYGTQIDMVHGKEKIGFSLPYMAVKSSMTLTIRVKKYQAPFGEFWMLECGPEGTVFDYPLYVQPNSEVTSRSSSVLFYFNPTTQLWEVQQSARQANPQMPIYHFSKYGISD